MAKNETDMEGEDTGDQSELRVYELGFHLDPELPQEEAKKTYQALKERITKGGTLVAEGEPQKVQLAYTISRSENHVRRDFDSAYFAWIAYETNGAGHDAAIEAAQAENRIIRFLDIRTEKDAATHAAEMHEIYAQSAREAEVTMAGEETVDAELDAALKEVGV
jgi:ribosomal protein S6